MNPYDELNKFSKKGVSATFEKDVISRLQAQGLTINEAKKLIDRTYINPSMDPETAAEYVRKRNQGVRAEDTNEMVNEEAFWVDALESLGLDSAEAEQIVNEADLRRVDKRVNWNKIKRAARKEGYTLGPNPTGKAQEGWPEIDPAILEEENRWRSILGEHGVSAEDADAIVLEASLQGTNRHANRQRIKEAAQFKRVNLDWGKIPGEDGDGPPTPASDNEPTSYREVGRSFAESITPVANQFGNWVANWPQPGGVTGVLAMLILLWTVLIKVNGSHTRLELIWMSLNGQTDLTLPPSKLQQLAEPVEDFVSGVEEVVSDAFHGALGDLPGQGIVNSVENAPKSALHWFGSKVAGFDARLP